MLFDPFVITVAIEVHELGICLQPIVDFRGRTPVLGLNRAHPADNVLDLQTIKSIVTELVQHLSHRIGIKVVLGKGCLRDQQHRAQNDNADTECFLFQWIGLEFPVAEAFGSDYFLDYAIGEEGQAGCNLYLLCG